MVGFDRERRAVKRKAKNNVKWADIKDAPDLASGNATSIDWTNVTGKPTFFSGAYGDLTGRPVLGSAAVAAFGDFATAAQGVLAASASQPGHTHAQTDVTGLVAALAGKQPLASVLTNTTAPFTTAQETKLAGVATGATANSADATLLGRANHTGTQAASTISDFTASARAQIEATLIAGTNITITPAGSGATRTLTLSAAGGGSSSPLALSDWFSLQRFAAGVTADNPFLGAAISTGTANTAVPVANVPNWCPLGIFIRSSATANSGYRVQTGSLTNIYFGGVSLKFRGKFLWRATATHTVRIGFHDSVTSADAVDGAYFEIIGTTISAKTANNSVRTTAPSTATLTVDRVYTFDIDVNAAGTSARFRAYENLTTTPILDQTITTNIPTTSARAFGAGIVATQSAAVITDIGVLFEMGLGTIEGFAKIYG